MSNEIATYSMILSKLSLGKSGTECPTKTQILAINSLIVIDNASSYGANECVKIDDIRKKVETWNYYLTVSPTTMSFSAGGGNKSFTVSSFKRKALDGVEQSGDTAVSLKSTVASGSGFSVSGTTVYASANETTSTRSGTITITQNESNKTATISLSQSADSISSYGDWVISVSANPTSIGSGGGTSTITATAKRNVYWASGDVTEETATPSLSTNLGSISNKVLTLGDNTSTSSRTATITASYGGKSATCTVTQAGAEPTIEYVFTWDDGSTSSKSESFQATDAVSAAITLVSTKNGSNHPWSVSSKPSWITTSTTSSKVTISASDNSGSARSGKVVLTQSGSGNTLTVNVSQGAKPAENVYVFTITPNTYDASYSSASFIPRTVSTKNGSNIGYSLTSGDTDWVVVSTTGKIPVEILKNTTSSTRSTTLVFTQDESGKTQSIKITQSGQPDEYILSMWPESNTSGVYTADVQNTDIEVRSLRNGQKHQIGVKSQPEWCTAYISSSNDDGIYHIDLLIQSNPLTQSRTGTIVFEQEDSGMTTSFTVSQGGAILKDNKLTITSLRYDTAFLFQAGITPVEGSNVYLSFVVPNTFTWKTSTGLTVNRGTIYAGELANIYVRENDRYKLVESFQLETGEQTITI